MIWEGDDLDIVKITLFGIAATILILFLRSYKSEWAVILSLTAGVMISMYLLEFLVDLSEILKTWEHYLGGAWEYMSILWKALGIAYLCEFAGNLCKDSGNTLIAGQIELCGKVAVMLLGMPVLWALLKTITGYQGV